MFPREDVRLRQENGIPSAPLEEVMQIPQVVEVQPGRLLARTRFDDEWDGIDPESGHPKLKPEPHDLPDSLLDGGVLDVEIRLECVKAVVVICSCLTVIRPGGVLNAWEDHPLIRPRRLLLGPTVIIAVLRACLPAPRLEPGMLVRGMVDN